MERGYVKLWRKTLDSGLLENGPAWQLFGYLLLNAAHRPHRKIVGGVVFDLQPGQVVFSRAKAAAKLDLSERQIRTAFLLLEKLEILTSRATNKCTIVSLVNWHRYNGERPADDQQNDQPIDQQATSTRPAGDQQTPPVSLDTRIKEFKNKNIYTASAPQQPQPAPPDGGAEHTPSTASRSRQEENAKHEPDGQCILTRKGLRLTGKRLLAFNGFWEAFAYKRGKAEAADAWLGIPQLTDSLVARICDAARQEAANRPQVEARGGTPKWAQGWLTARRWEDYAPEEPPPLARDMPDPVPKELTPEEQEKAKTMRRRLEADRQRREESALTGQGTGICAQQQEPMTTNATL